MLGPIDLIVPRGCIVGYIGENGAGKSTTIKLLLNLMTPDEVEIKLLGKDIREFTPQMKKDIAYVFDDLSLPEEMTLKNAQRFHRNFYGRAWQDNTFSDLTARFNLPDNKAIIGTRPHQFGVEVMLKKDLVPSDLELEKVSVEDIMVYMIKGDWNTVHDIATADFERSCVIGNSLVFACLCHAAIGCCSFRNPASVDIQVRSRKSQTHFCCPVFYCVCFFLLCGRK